MILYQALRPIEVLLVEDSPSDANLTIKGFLNAKSPMTVSVRAASRREAVASLLPLR